jgi:putative redox protein
MVRIEVVYEGDLHTTCVHGPSGRELATDAPRDNEGRGESFSPTDLLATALGSCLLTVMGIVARRRGWRLEGARATVEKHMLAEPERRIGRLAVRIDMPAGLPAESRAVLERAALSCPVHRSLHPDVKVELDFRWAGSSG